MMLGTVKYNGNHDVGDSQKDSGILIFGIVSDSGIHDVGDSQ